MGSAERLEVREVEQLFLAEQDWHRLSMSEGTRVPQAVRLGSRSHLTAVGGGWTPLAALAPFPYRSARPLLFLRLCQTGHHAGRDGPGHRGEMAY